MKRFFLILFSAFLLFSFSGCSDLEKSFSKAQEETEYRESLQVDPRFRIIGEYDYADFRFYTMYDSETLVIYQLVWKKVGYSGGLTITPLYNSDGSFCLYKEE